LNNRILISLLFLSLQVPSLRPLFKYVPAGYGWLIAAYFAGTLAATWLLVGQRAWVRKVLNFKALPIVLVALILAANIWVYPIADALKYQDRGTPQDDALIVGGELLARGENPYEGRTFRNEQVSAGPGWIVLALPFTLPGLYVLFTPFWVALAAFVIYRLRRSAADAALFLLLLMSSLSFWELLVTGSDMLAMGIAFLLAFWFIRWASEHEAKWLAIAAIFLAMVTTSRIVFGYLIPVATGFLFAPLTPPQTEGKRRMRSCFSCGAWEHSPC
jgi:hypothetical protein